MFKRIKRIHPLFYLPLAFLALPVLGVFFFGCFLFWLSNLDSRDNTCFFD